MTQPADEMAEPTASGGWPSGGHPAGRFRTCGGCGDHIWPNERIYPVTDGEAAHVRCAVCEVKRRATNRGDTGAPECDGLCVTAADIGVGGADVVAYPHPSCPLHAPGEVCECGYPDRCLSPTHDPKWGARP